MAIFWNVAPCCLVGIDQHFRGAYCLYHQGDSDCKLLWNADQYLLDYMVHHPRRQPSSYLPWEPQISPWNYLLVLTFLADKQIWIFYCIFHLSPSHACKIINAINIEKARKYKKFSSLEASDDQSWPSWWRHSRSLKHWLLSQLWCSWLLKTISIHQRFSIWLHSYVLWRVPNNVNLQSVWLFAVLLNSANMLLIISWLTSSLLWRSKTVGRWS
jgi:hypothetical protein